MDIETLTSNATLAFDRLEAQIEEFAGRNRLKHDCVLLACFDARAYTFGALGIFPHRIKQMNARIAELRDELWA